MIDEYGCTQGIVTLEDIIEEIVGDIDDEYDETDSMFKRVAPDVYIFEAKTPLSDFLHVVGVEEDSLGELGDAETLAGLLLEIKGDFPSMKETLELGRLKFRVLEIEKHRIMKVKVTVADEASASDQDKEKKSDK